MSEYLSYEEMHEAMEISIVKGLTCDRTYEGWNNITLKSGKIVAIKLGYPDGVTLGPVITS